jgi:GT2 family glycosyltransferase
VAESRGEWLAFFDDDQWADPRWLAELYKVAQEKGADCVDGPVFLDLPQTKSWELSPNWRLFLGEKFLGNCIVRSSKDHLGSGNLLIRKSLFTGLGAFDSNFPFYSYDFDLFWRLEEAGYYSWYSPHALVHHVIPESRLEITYLVETCQRVGFTYAQAVGKNAGALKLALATLLRLGAISVRDIPLYSIYRLLGPESHFLDKRISLWFGWAFVRGALAHLLPKLFKQERFINALYSSYRKRNG